MKILNKVFNKFANKPVNAIIWAKFILDIICVIFGYKAFPYLLNYPPKSINTPFQLSVNPYYYSVYYFSIFFVGIVADLILACIMLKPLKKINSNNIREVYKARATCYRFPKKALLLTTCVIPLVVIIGMLLITNTNAILTIKIGMLAVVLLGIPNLFIYFFSNAILKQVLIKSFNTEIYNNEKVKQTKIYTKLMIEIFTTITISLILIFMYITANITNEIGKYKFETYKEKLNNIAEDISKEEIQTNELEQYLTKKLFNEKWFIEINGKFIGKASVSEFMKKYIEYYAKDNGGRTYENFGENMQGVVNYINIENQEVLIGITYSIPNSIFLNLFFIIVSFLIINICIIYLSGNSIGKSVESMNKSLSNINKSKNIELKLLPITSTDEIGRLTKEINKVQEKTNNYIKQIEQDQYTMQRQAQFAILGEFAGGIAHDLNSPLSAIQLDIGMLKDDILPDKIQASPEVKEILQDVLNNIDRSIEKMSKTIAGVKNQIRATADTEKESFSFVELIEGIEILFGSILRKNNCQLLYNKDNDYELYGEKNKLDRVIGNLIKNSIDAYVEKGKKGKVEIAIDKNSEKYTIKIIDQAGGIPKEIKDTIFKEMKTTKGENGTGFGLYYSNTIIESSFKGKLYFDTKENVGTTFYIDLPLKYNSKEEK